MGTDDIKVIRMTPRDQKDTDNEFYKYGKIISEFSQELASLSIELIQESEELLLLLIRKLGSAKAKKIVRNLTSGMYGHLLAIYKIDNDNILSYAFNEVKDINYNRIIDLFNALHMLDIKDAEGIKILSKSAVLLKGLDSLARAAQIRDNYVKEIIYNRPNFSMHSKINSVVKGAKISEETHIIKYGNLFLNTEKDGNISCAANVGDGESRALGLFADDMRFIDRYEIVVNASSYVKLHNTLKCAENYNFESYDENLYGDNVTVKRKRIVNGALFEKLEISNSGQDEITVDIVLSSIIKDIFEVRGKISTYNPPSNVSYDCDGNIIINTALESNIYGVRINLTNFDNPLCPVSIDEENGRVIYKLNLDSGTVSDLSLIIQPLINYLPYIDGEILTEPPASFEEAKKLVEVAKKTEFAKIIIDSDIPDIQKTVDKCIKDLNMLVNYINIDDKSYGYISAGLPRYSALFGRDSIITALEIFPLNQEIAKDTLELLAIFQGKSFDQRHIKELNDIKSSDWPLAAKSSAIKGLMNYYIEREESQGKILHELRTGELARIGRIPHTPYYGTVDATPLWLILYAEYFNWSGDKKLMEKLRPNAEAALNWIESNIIDGYLRFTGSPHSRLKIQNQGWKDAGDSIRHIINARGALCDPSYPIALAEVQGYVYRAFILMSEIYKNLKEDKNAESLIIQADNLKRNFNKDFWLREEQFFSMALDKINKPVSNITSNIGQCMAMGIVDDDKIKVLEERIMSPEMFTGWGIRTLGSKCPAYDPLSYHNGSVWLHDSAFTAMGLSDDSRAKVAKALFEAAGMFENNRVPELFGGFQRKEDDTSIQCYPEACSPQAWASGSLIWLLLKIAGLTKKGILEPSYTPDWLKSISIEGI